MPARRQAGTDPTVLLGQTVQLNGTGSSDPEGMLLTFKWALVSRPMGSTATLSDTTIADPVFVADRTGMYVAQLIVNDGTVDSAPSSVTISTGNLSADMRSPVRTRPSPPQRRCSSTGSVVDPDGAPLAFSWSLLSDRWKLRRSFGWHACQSDVRGGPRGIYVAQLIVGDGTSRQRPDTVMITVQERRQSSVVFVADVPPQHRPSARRSSPSSRWPTTDRRTRPASPHDSRFRPGTRLPVENIMQGSYDSTTGIWTIGSMPPNTAAMALALIVESGGPLRSDRHDHREQRAGSESCQQHITAVVTPAGDADLRIAFSDPPVGIARWARPSRSPFKCSMTVRRVPRESSRAFNCRPATR